MVAGQQYAMVLAYDGSFFHGWQIQRQTITVQGQVEHWLEILCGGPVKVWGSGRTDAGVHALGQVAHFFPPRLMEPRRLQLGLNALGKAAISVRLVQTMTMPPPHPDPASKPFHARHRALSKTYRYQVFNRRYPPLFAPQGCWWIRSRLNVEAMRTAAQSLLGTHDFSAFRARECAARSPRRTIHAIQIETGEWMNATLRIEITASGFLQHMARIICGTLIAVGHGRLSPDALAFILASRDHNQAAETAPARGLYLLEVQYDWERFPQLHPSQLAAGAF